MRTVNVIKIDANPRLVFNLAADILNWPKLLPHYRWVRQLGEDVSGPVFEMAALRGTIPVKWTSVQMLDEQALRIYYRYIGGATRGMWVEWDIRRRTDGACDVAIYHDLTLLNPIIRSWLGKLITAKFFVTHIADKTLAHIKLAAESCTGVEQCVEGRS